MSTDKEKEQWILNGSHDIQNCASAVVVKNEPAEQFGELRYCYWVGVLSSTVGMSMNRIGDQATLVILKAMAIQLEAEIAEEAAEEAKTQEPGKPH